MSAIPDTRPPPIRDMNRSDAFFDARLKRRFASARLLVAMLPPESRPVVPASPVLRVKFLRYHRTQAAAGVEFTPERPLHRPAPRE